jgi:hypothetical protein
VGDLRSYVHNHYPKFDPAEPCIVRVGQFCYSEPALELRDQRSEDQRTDDRRQRTEDRLQRTASQIVKLSNSQMVVNSLHKELPI